MLSSSGRGVVTVAILCLGVLAVFTVGVVRVLDTTSESILSAQAEQTSQAWANHIGKGLEGIEAIAQGAPPTPEDLRFMTGVLRFGGIYRFKIFDAQGKLRLASDNLGTKGLDSMEPGDHNDVAMGVVASGRPITFLRDGSRRPNHPSLYVSSYAPIFKNGTLIAVSEVYMDQTGQSAFLENRFLVFGMKIAALTALVLVGPVVLVFFAWGLHRKNRALEMERNRALTAERTKSQFLANMSHELRTPLNAIIGFSEAINAQIFGPLGNDKYREYAGDIHRSGRLLKDLVGDILDISAVESGKLSLYETELTLEQVVADVVRLLRMSAEENRLALTVETTTPMRLLADETRVKQMLVNLLSNAIKFTHAGGRVSIAWRLEADGSLALTVRDTGIGMDEDSRGRALIPFARANVYTTRQREGTGLGLPLVKGLVELHGGHLRLDSEQGVGTTATLNFPKGRVLLATTPAI